MSAHPEVTPRPDGAGGAPSSYGAPRAFFVRRAQRRDFVPQRGPRAQRRDFVPQRRPRAQRPCAWTLLLASSIAASACGGGGETSGSTTSTGGQTTSSGGAGGGGGALIGGSGGDTLAGCATATAEAKALPLDMYIMLDQSGSMTGPKWAAVTSALDSFWGGASVGDLGVGLQYFPLPGADVCDYTAYAVPDVPISTLSSNKGALAMSLLDHTPAGETPTLSALQGAMAYSKAWAEANPKHTVIVVLATDGEPNVCGSTIDNVAQAAKVGHDTAPSVRTFVVGVGSFLSTLDAVAAAGGTDKAILVDDSAQSTEEELVLALNTIRGAALPCDYEIPPPPDGETLDYGFVNVLYGKGGAKGAVVPQVPGASDCQGSPESWYYDDPAKPSRVVFCDGLCAEVKADAMAKIDIVLGCETEVAK